MTTYTFISCLLRMYSVDRTAGKHSFSIVSGMHWVLRWLHVMYSSCTDCRKPQHRRIVFLIISFFEFLSEHVVNKVSGWRFKLTLNFTGFCANGRYLIYYAAVSQIILRFWFFGLGFKFPPVSICFVDIMQASEMAYSITAAASQCNSVSLPIYS